MKIIYKNCEAKIDTTLVRPFSPSTSVHFTPVVEVDCNSVGKHVGIATGKWFPSPDSAERYGVELARAWIDTNLERMSHADTR